MKRSKRHSIYSFAAIVLLAVMLQWTLQQSLNAQEAAKPAEDANEEKIETDLLEMYKTNKSIFRVWGYFFR